MSETSLIHLENLQNESCFRRSWFVFILTNQSCETKGRQVLQTPLKTKEEGKEEGEEATRSCKQGLLLMKLAWVLQWVSVLSELGSVFTLKEEQRVALIVLLR